MKPVICIAGTPIDTAFGLEILQQHNIHTMAHPISKTCKEQNDLQLLSKRELQLLVEKIIFSWLPTTDLFFVYCNSLSAAVDFEHIAEKYQCKIITPLFVYDRLGNRYKSVLLLTANTVSSQTLEQRLLESNPKLKTVVYSNLQIVEDIENKKAPEQILRDNGILNLLEGFEYFSHADQAALILGCTHFPYFKEALRNKTAIPIIDPADWMLDALKSSLS